MPLPKPSKTAVSRRIKKPKPLLFPASRSELLNPPVPNKLHRKRRVRVICTDPDATDSSSDEEDAHAPFSPKLTHKRLVREICLPASPPTYFYECQQEETSLGTVLSSSPCPASERRNGFKIARKELGLQDLYERSNEPSVASWVDNCNVCPGAEEFMQFLAEFFGVQEEGSIPVCNEELDLLDDDAFDNPLNLELDFEPATWINSVPTFV